MAKKEKLIGLASEHLEDGEQVLAGVFGAYQTKRLGHDAVRNGVLLATDRRLVFYAKRFAGFDLESFPYEGVSSFEQSKGVMGHRFRFFASGNEVTLKWIHDPGEALDAFAAAVKERAGRKPAGGSAGTPGEPTPARAQRISPDPVDEIRRFAALRDEGLITEEEFVARKKKILG